MIYAVLIILGLYTTWDAFSSRRLLARSRESERLAVARYDELLAKVEARAKVPLTQTKARAQDAPKRFTGPQLRRMAEHVNVEAFAGLQERPNSEILKEQE